MITEINQVWLRLTFSTDKIVIWANTFTLILGCCLLTSCVPSPVHSLKFHAHLCTHLVDSRQLFHAISSFTLDISSTKERLLPTIQAQVNVARLWMQRGVSLCWRNLTSDACERCYSSAGRWEMGLQSELFNFMHNKFSNTMRSQLQPQIS